MGLKKTNRDSLELYIEEELGDLLNLRLTSGSGNQLGDGDLKPRYRKLDDIHFGIECKRTSRGKNHNVKWDDYQKARKQVERGGQVLLFVTQNEVRDVMVHLRFQDFKWLLEIIQEAYQIVSEQWANQPNHKESSLQ